MLMNYFYFKKTFNNKTMPQKIYVCGKSLLPEKLYFSYQQPYSIATFVNFNDDKIADFCVKLTLDNNDSVAHIMSNVKRRLENRIPEFIKQTW